MKHTGGNPFFIETVLKIFNNLLTVLQFLKTSVDHGLIFFNFETTNWDWDEERIMTLEVSENIVEYLVQNTLQDSMHEETVAVLKLAACLGNREFNSFILSNVLDLPVAEITRRLWPAVMIGLIVTADDSFKVGYYLWKC